MSGDPPEWLRGRFRPIADDLDWEALAVGLELPGTFASVVALADEVLPGEDPWGDRGDRSPGLTREQRDHLA